MIPMDDSIRAIIFSGFSDMADYLAAVHDNRDGAGFRLTSRIRLHGDRPTGDPFQDDDKKFWFGGNFGGTLDDAITRVRELALDLCAKAAAAGMLTGDAQVHVLVRGDSTVDEFAARLMALPFAYQKRVN